MTLAQRLASWLRGDPPGAIRVRILVKGRIGAGWFDVDRKLSLPPGATLAVLIEAADRAGLQLSQAIEASPHLRHTLMWNGQRTPVAENLDREVRDGDELYLLGPVAGGRSVDPPRPPRSADRSPESGGAGSG